MNEPCRVPGCPGHYEREMLARAQHLPDRSLALVTEIPARVCDFCGDTLLDRETVEALARLRTAPPPARATVPLYDLAEAPPAPEVVTSGRAGVTR